MGGSPPGCGSCSTPDGGAEAPTTEGMGRAAAASSLESPRARDDLTTVGRLLTRVTKASLVHSFRQPASHQPCSLFQVFIEISEFQIS